MYTLKKLLQYIAPYWSNGVLSVFFNLLGTIFSLFSFTMAIPFLGILFDQQEIIKDPVAFEFSAEAIKHNFNYFLSQIIVNYGENKALLAVTIFVVFLVLLKGIFNYLGNYSIVPLRNGVIYDLRDKMYKKILRLPMGYFSGQKNGDIISRMTSDIKEIENSILKPLDKAVKSPIKIIVFLFSLFAMSAHLTIFVLILLPISGYLISILGKNLKRKSAKGQKRMGSLLSYIEETLFGMKIIKIFTGEQTVHNKFNRDNSSYKTIMDKLMRRKYLARPLSEILSTSAIVVIMWYGGQMVLSGESPLSPQAFITYLIIFSQIISPAKSLTNIYYNFQKGAASFDRVEYILYAPESIQEISNAKPIKNFEKNIEYRNVSFYYDEEFVLKNINLNIQKGQTIALVGQSGAGKSTLAELLPRFYDPIKGEILIDGKNIRNFRIKDLRGLIGMVSQEQILFNDTIFNNIAFGKNNATKEEIIKASKIANAHNFIKNTEYGYETNVGDRGNKLSGGQRQRISIARAIVCNPPVLILDEATSALDTESEKLVKKALNNLMQTRTSIVIAHRLSTVKNADRIFVLEDGKLIEQGNHDELLAQNGVFKQLYDTQFS